MKTEARVRELFPEVAEIKNKKLADAVIALWLKSWQESDWDDLTDVPKNDRMSEVNLVQHVRGVTRAAIAIAKVAIEMYDNIKIDMDVMITGSLLHDMSKPIEGNKDGKTARGKLFPHGYLAAQMCQDAGLPNEIVHIILTHSKNTTPMVPKTMEALIVHYADYCDSDILNIRYDKKILLKFY